MFAVLFDRGGSAVMSDPCYACYANFIMYTGGEIISVPTLEENGFQLNVEETRKKLASINRRANPTAAERLERTRIEELLTLSKNSFT